MTAPADLRTPQPAPSLEVVPDYQPSVQEVVTGACLELGADALCAARVKGALAIAQYIGETPEYRSWPLAGAFGALAASDKVDGWVSRWGRNIRHGDNRDALGVLGSYSDHLSDKFLTNVVSAAIARREYDNGNVAYATALAGATGVTMARDGVLTVERVLADIEGLKTNARSMGKIKTVLQMGTITAALSPLGEKPGYRVALGAAFIGNSAVSLASGLDLHRSLVEQRAQR